MLVPVRAKTDLYGSTYKHRIEGEVFWVEEADADEYEMVGTAEKISPDEAGEPPAPPDQPPAELPETPAPLPEATLGSVTLTRSKRTGRQGAIEQPSPDMLS